MKSAHPSFRDFSKIKRGMSWNDLSAKEQHRLDVVLLVYWTCVQMES